MKVKPGLDVLLESPGIQGSVGLLTTVASLTLDGKTAQRGLTEAGVQVAALFAPEHGYYGIGAAGESIADERLGEIPIHSLYKGDDSDERNTPLLRDLSLILVDLQDVGMRWYTFLATLRQMLLACAAAKVPVWVLDRPNPLGGIEVEGPIAEPEFFSLVATAALPIRYGLTFGEVARWLNRDIGADLDVIPMAGWRREMHFSDTGLRWSSPSPMIPHAMTALIYGATCLMEGLTVSEGRGTPLPFEQIGAPYIIGEMLADELNALNLPGVIFSPTWFRPYTGKFEGERCKGVRISVTDAPAFRSFTVGLHLVATLRRTYPQHVTWVIAPDGKGFWFDKLVGNSHLREEIDENVNIGDILVSYSQDLQRFQSSSGEFWLYE
jgi:uncharacterized protein YbbC (DUF1343 family)